MKISFECYASKQSYQALSTRLTCNILLFVLHRSLLAESLCSTFVCSMPLFAVVLYFSIVLYKTILFTKNLHFFYFSVHILFFIIFFFLSIFPVFLFFVWVPHNYSFLASVYIVFRSSGNVVSLDLHTICIAPSLCFGLMMMMMISLICILWLSELFMHFVRLPSVRCLFLIHICGYEDTYVCCKLLLLLYTVHFVAIIYFFSHATCFFAQFHPVRIRSELVVWATFLCPIFYAHIVTAIVIARFDVARNWTTASL